MTNKPPAPSAPSAATPSTPSTPPTAQGTVSRAWLGKQLTLVGWAVNRKNGAALEGDGFSVWIANLSHWPDGYYRGGPRGKKVRVTGVLADDHGLPVFVQRKDQPIVQGMPVPEGTDVKRASHRFLLRDARWELIP